MTIDQILTLISAGYTKEEISALDGAAAAQQEQQPAQQEQQPAQQEQQEIQPAQPLSQQDLQQGADTGAAILAAINKLTATLQASNLQNSEIPGGASAATPEDVLANIINPTFKKENK